VEVPVYVDRGGFHPIHVGSLPPQLAALVHTSVMVEEMAVEAALTGDARLVMQACIFDPLSAAVLSLAEIRGMVDAMFKQNKPYLPQFR
jgi:alpha-galactosidase